MSGCPLSLFSSTRLDGPFRDSREVDRETKPQIKPRLFSLLLFSQPHGTLSTPNILDIVKPPIKICFSLPPIDGQMLRRWKLQSGWKAPSATSHSSSLSLISQSLSFSSSDRAFSCQAKHVIPFKHCPGVAHSPESFSLARLQWRWTEIPLFILFTIYRECLFLGEL